MFEIFEEYITAHVPFTSAELKLMRSLSIQRTLRRRQLLLREGEVCRHKTFVTNGLLRTYFMRDNGAESIMRFAPEKYWAIDAQSYNNQSPSGYYIEALEDTDVLMWSRESMNELFAVSPAFRSYSEKVKENTLYESQHRVLINISATTEEKYQEFIASFPDVFRRVPLHMVASYLGVSRETLSRIRHGQLKKQKEI